MGLRSSLPASGLGALAAWIGLAVGGATAGGQAPPAGRWHNEAYRPQFHFTADKGWLNDPNGLVFYKGEYHLFFQHNPNGTNWVNDLSWGHAASSDLLHWKYLPEAVPPTPIPGGKMAGSWSGTGFVDWDNTSGFGSGAEKPLVVAWTATGLGQCLAYSNDRGRTFTKFEGNPVVPMDPPRTGDWDRDPDVFWYAPGKHWVMVMSISGKGFVFNTSPDLKHWTKRSLLAGLFECPNCFELPVDGDSSNRKWVIWDASGRYFVGSFDGKTFAKEAGPFVLDRGRNYYAAQTWSDAPDGRRIGICWMREGKFPDMPFNQQMGIPFELSLRTISAQGVRLVKMPVKEVDSLRYDRKHWENQPLKPGANLLEGMEGDTFDMEVEFEPGEAKEVGLEIRGQKIVWKNGTLSCAGASVPVAPVGGALKLRVLADRTSLEIFAADGAASLTCALPPRGVNRTMATYSDGNATIRSMSVWRMRSVWE